MKNLIRKIVFSLLLFACYTQPVSSQNSVNAKGIFTGNTQDSTSIKNTLSSLQALYGNYGGLYFNNLTNKWRIWVGTCPACSVDSTWIDLPLAGGTTGLTSANNGLSTPTCCNVQLGGPLIKSTTISNASFPLVIGSTLTFGIDNSLKGAVMSFDPITHIYNVGDANTITGNSTLSFGISNTVTSSSRRATNFGSSNINTDGYSFGENNTNDASSVTIGRSNTAIGGNSISIGTGNKTGQGSIAIGISNNSTGQDFANAIGFGLNSTGQGAQSLNIGLNNQAKNTNSITLGTNLTSSADYAYILGSGNNGSGNAVNSTANSFALALHNLNQVDVLIQTGKIDLGTSTLGAASANRLTSTATHIYWSDGVGNFQLDQQGGGGVPGGANTNVQFNNAGSFGGDANFDWVASTAQAVIRDGSNSRINIGTASLGSGSANIQLTDVLNSQQIEIGSGIGVRQNSSNSLFLSQSANPSTIEISSTSGRILIHNLPTSSTGLPSGALWVDTITGILHIIP